MTAFLIYELKVALLITAFYACWRLFLANQTCHQQNRWILISSVVASFVLPFCKITIHKTIDITGDMEAAPVIANNALSDYPAWMLVLVAILIIGVVLIVARLALSLHQLRKLKQPSEIHPMSDGHKLAVCETASQPFSWWNTVFLNRKDFEEGTTALLTHELGHIRLHHSLDVVLIELFTALQWFNPAMWMLRRDLRTIHEYEADQQVLSHGFNDIQYLNLLVRMAASQGGYSLVNGISNKSTLKKRITMITKPKSNRLQWWRLAYILPIVAISLYTSCATKVDYRNLDKLAITLEVKDGRECFGVKAPVGAFYTWLESGHLAEHGDVKEERGWNTRSYFDVENHVVKLDGKEITKDNIPYIPVESIKEVKLLQGDKPRVIELYTTYVSGFNRTEKYEWPEKYKNSSKRWIFFKVEDIATGQPLSGAEVTVEETGHKAFTNSEGWCEMKIALGTTVKATYPGLSSEAYKVEALFNQDLQGYTFWMNKPGVHIYNSIDVKEQPKYEGDADKWFAEHVQLSSADKQEKLYPVTVCAVINEDGSVSGARIRHGIRKSLNDEAVRLVSAMPNWKPAKEKGQAVKCCTFIRVNFDKISEFYTDSIVGESALENTYTSQEENVFIGAYVRDAKSKTYLNDADVTITNIDGMKLGKPIIQEVSKNSKMYRYVASVPRASQYIIKVSKKGYQSEQRIVTLRKEEKQKLADEIYLQASNAN